MDGQVHEARLSFASVLPKLIRMIDYEAQGITASSPKRYPERFPYLSHSSDCTTLGLQVNASELTLSAHVKVCWIECLAGTSMFMIYWRC
jgi:hypothetical protein